MSSTQRNSLTPHMVGAIVLFAIVAAWAFLLRHGTLGGAPLERPLDAGLEYTLDSLPNGVRYYVHARSSGERAELRLVVDAGSLQEDEDQRGLAHAVEHMVFRGTRRFPGGAVERWFDAIGMRRGDDVNATTSTDDTRFRMTVPTTRAGSIDTALAMLASMAHEATFDAGDARRESGVLLEEWRTSRGVEARLADARRPLLHAGTGYVARAVIGDTGVLRRFDLAALRRFYDRWYRPELMAVVAVGDFDEEEVAALVRRHFGAIPKRGPRVGRLARPVGDTVPAPPRALVVADPEARVSRVAIWRPFARARYHTRGDYRAALVSSIWEQVLDGRLEDAALWPDSPVADAEVERRTLTRGIAADVVTVTAMQGETLPALDLAVGQLRALARDGPSAIELEEVTQSLLNGALANARSGDSDADRADEFVDHFLTGNAVFTSSMTYELAKELLPTVTADDVRAFARARAAERGEVVVVATTTGDSATRVAPEAVVARAKAAHSSPSVSGAATDVRALLAAVKPAPGEIVQEREIAEPHAYEWTLSNGMRVLLKPTSFNYDDVQLRIVAPGGASLATDDGYASAYLADAIVGATGVGSIPAPRLRRWLGSTSISLSPSMRDDALELDGISAPTDLEQLFQLVHLHLTAPRRDTVAFRRYQARAASYERERGRDPEAEFRDSVTAAFVGRDPRALRRGAAFYLDARLDDALAFWKQRTANGAGFTVAITGDFTLAHARPLVQRYLASIPRGTAEQPRARTLPVPAAGTAHEVLANGVVERARTMVGFAGPFTLSNGELDALEMVQEVAERALNERLREEMGGTYGVDVSLGIDVVPPARYTMTVEFETDPGRVEELAAAAFDELARLSREGPTAAQFAGAREARVRDFDGRLEDNDYWADELAFHARHGWPLEGIAAHGRDAQATTLDGVRRACARYIPAGDYVRVTMRPRPPVKGRPVPEARGVRGR